MSFNNSTASELWPKPNQIGREWSEVQCVILNKLIDFSDSELEAKLGPSGQCRKCLLEGRYQVVRTLIEIIK